MQDSGKWGGAKQLQETDNIWGKFNDNEGWRNTDWIYIDRLNTKNGSD